jgi:hypothetical protein
LWTGLKLNKGGKGRGFLTWFESCRLNGEVQQRRKCGCYGRKCRENCLECRDLGKKCREKYKKCGGVKKNALYSYRVQPFRYPQQKSTNPRRISAFL